MLLCSISFGTSPAHGTVDFMLTTNDEITKERLQVARDGVIGNPCVRDTKHRGEAYKGPGWEAIKSSVSRQLPCD